MTKLTELLVQTQHEILYLRRRNELLSAKVEVMELFGQMLNASPPVKSAGETVDVAWLLERKIAELREADEQKERDREVPRNSLGGQKNA